MKSKPIAITFDIFADLLIKEYDYPEDTQIYEIDTFKKVGEAIEVIQIKSSEGLPAIVLWLVSKTFT